MDILNLANRKQKINNMVYSVAAVANVNVRSITQREETEYNGVYYGPKSGQEVGPPDIYLARLTRPPGKGKGFYMVMIYLLVAVLAVMCCMIIPTIWMENPNPRFDCRDPKSSDGESGDGESSKGQSQTQAKANAESSNGKGNVETQAKANAESINGKGNVETQAKANVESSNGKGNVERNVKCWKPCEYFCYLFGQIFNCLDQIFNCLLNCYDSFLFCYNGCYNGPHNDCTPQINGPTDLLPSWCMMVYMRCLFYGVMLVLAYMLAWLTDFVSGYQQPDANNQINKP